VLMSVKHEDGTPRFTADEITGMFISMMFAGHHTTSGTAAWTLIELLRDPMTMARVVAEIDGLFAEGGTVSFQALRDIPVLDACVKEALRLHPPLILLLRVAQEDLEVGGYSIRAGDLVAATPAVSNRLAQHFPDADRFDPQRYLEPRFEDTKNPWTWIPFGGGKHRCVGAAFAQMQLKAIFLVLLRRFTFEMAQPSETYRDDFSKMVIQLQQPCAVHVTPRGL
jgi:sterol 14-demethylase